MIRNECILTIPDLVFEDTHTGLCKFYVKIDDKEEGFEIECEKDEDIRYYYEFEKKWINVIVWGKEVNDFHTIDKAQIFALHHSAIQELSRRNDTLVAENTAKTAEIAMLTTDNVQLKADISLIKQHLGI